LKRSTITLLSILLTMPLAFGTATASIASGASSNWDETDALQYEWYRSNGVSSNTAIALIEQFNSGIPLDSMTGGQPGSVLITETSEEIETKYTFSDGSISISTLEKPAAGSGSLYQSMAVGGCNSVVSGSGYANHYDCAVAGTNGVYLTIQFRADYTRSSSGLGIINALRSPSASAGGGTATTPVLSITRKQGYSSSPARAQATTQFSNTGASYTARLFLNVHGGNAWTTQDF